MAFNLWKFKTVNFTVTLEADYDPDADTSWRDRAQVNYDLDHGVEYYTFAVVVRDADGLEVGRDSLGGSGYSDPHDFYRDHRDPDPQNRNCSIMRAAKGDNVIIAHYFPGMVKIAVHQARQTLAHLQGVKLRRTT